MCHTLDRTQVGGMWVAVGVESEAHARSNPLAIVALAASALGLALCLGGVGAFILDFVPHYVSFGLWFYLVYFSALGLLAALVGLVLGLALWLPARRGGRPEPRARLAVTLAALAIAVEASTLLVAQLYVWLG
jgi:hypothetical protein